MFNSFNFSYVTPMSLIEGLVSDRVCGTGNPIFSWIAFGKIPENPVVTPSATVQVVYPSSVNRYLQSVTVNAVTTPTP